MNIPLPQKKPVIDTLFSYQILDEYRWLEEVNSKETQDWLANQHVITKSYLRKLAVKINSSTSIDRYAYVKYDNPYKDGDYYFTYAYYNNVGVPALFYQTDLRSDPDILIDPSFISAKDNILLQNYKVAKDSKHLAYQFSRNGSDWGEIKVINLKTGLHRSDHLKHIKFSQIAWKEDGFYYSKYPDAQFNETVGQEIYYHTIGTEQNEDKLVFKRKDSPYASFDCITTNDERFMIIKERDLSKSVINIFYIDFNEPNAALRPLLTRLKLSENISIIDNHNDKLIAISYKDVNNGMLIKIDPKNPRDWESFIPEFSSSLLLEVELFHDKVVCIYQSNGKQQVVFFDMQGNVLHAIDLPFGFAVNRLNGAKQDKEILFSYEGYTQPKIVYRLNLESFEMKPLRATVVNFDFTQYKTKELEVVSFDGTIVPLFLVYKNDIDLSKSNPLLLKAYGGFGVVSIPYFSPDIVHFLNKGGIFAFANIRGGGDKGKEWALSGKGVNKMNSFNDFIATSEYLIENNYTTREKFAITGKSNGGLVVAVAMTLRPDLYKVVVPEVAPLDMVRFEKFTIGHFHKDEYGSTRDSLGLLNLLSYSPFHTINDTINYPACMIMTSENDDRVPPFHSYKFAAKLQNRAKQINPILLRVEKDAGHYGATGSFKKVLKERAAIYDFIISNLMD